MNLFRPVRIPLHMWVIDYFCLFVACLAAVSWICLNRSQLNIGVFVIFFIFLAFFGGALKNLFNEIKISKLTVEEDGLRKADKHESSYQKWEDVTRYERSRGRYGIKSFTLFFKNGERIQIPATIKDFKEIHNYCLEKIEKIGTFEDGRKVPCVLFSIPLPFLKKGGVPVTQFRKKQ